MTLTSLLRPVAGAVLLAATALTPAFAADSVLDDILSAGKLKVGTTGDWNPMSIKDPATNTYQGYDIDVMTELAKDLEVELEFVPTDWKTLVNGVVAGKYHMTGSASISPDQENVTVAATLGTTQEQQVKDFFPNAKHKIIEAPARDFQEVLAGRADAHITSNVEAYKLVAQYPQMMVVPVEKPRARTPIAMLLPQGDQVSQVAAQQLKLAQSLFLSGTAERGESQRQSRCINGKLRAGGCCHPHGLSFEYNQHV